MMISKLSQIAANVYNYWYQVSITYPYLIINWILLIVSIIFLVTLYR